MDGLTFGGWIPKMGKSRGVKNYKADLLPRVKISTPEIMDRRESVLPQH